MEAVARLGVDENTLIIFTSDNGPWLSYGNHAGSAKPLREGKGTTWDGGVRVPFIARWPGQIPNGLEVSTPAMTIDLFPTLATLIEAPLPPHTIDGKPIWSLMTGESTESPQEAYYFYYHQNELHAIRSGKWKLHFPHTYRTMEGRALGKDGIPGKYNYGAEVGLELYDLEADISESNDLASTHPEIVEELSRMAETKRADLGDKLTETAATGAREPGRITPQN